MSYLSSVITAAVVLGGATMAFAQPHVAVDEWGTAIGDVNPGVLQHDPTNGYVQAPVLVFQLPFAVSVPGDVRLIDPTNNGVSDVIRFTGNGQMIFYSDGIYDGLDAPADIPWPLEALNPNPFGGPVLILNESGDEGASGFFYVPSPVDPGFFPGVEYNFISDGFVPEPATLSLFALAGISLLVRRRCAR